MEGHEPKITGMGAAQIAAMKHRLNLSRKLQPLHKSLSLLILVYMHSLCSSNAGWDLGNFLLGVPYTFLLSSKALQVRMCRIRVDIVMA